MYSTHTVTFSALTLLVGWQEWHPAHKKYGGWWRWALVSPDGVAPSRMVGVSASVNLPLHHKVQKFSSGTGSPGWSRKNGRKTVVVVCTVHSLVWQCKLLMQYTLLSTGAVLPSGLSSRRMRLCLKLSWCRRPPSPSSSLSENSSSHVMRLSLARTSHKHSHHVTSHKHTSTTWLHTNTPHNWRTQLCESCCTITTAPSVLINQGSLKQSSIFQQQPSGDFFMD